MKSVAVIGDNCVDYYSNLGCYYLTGNIVDTGINLAHLGVPTSIITTVADDEYGKDMFQCFKDQGLDTSHVRIAHGNTAITYMQLNEKERIHGDYVEGVLEDMVFHTEDVKFAATHDLSHSAFWGKADGVLPDIKSINPDTLISFDFADRLKSQLVKNLDGVVDIGFFSYQEKDEKIIQFLKERIQNGMKLGVATLGERGSIALSRDQIYEAGIVKAEVVNTVGAGDSFIAGFLAEFLNSGDIKQSLKKGAEVAAHIISIFEPWEDKRKVQG
ncbi:fructoselysine 6-kinase [Cytobacillus sp. Hz8]|uniref:fructoselysine 6-kinase n=1 Tax=Cytobacillus sp. Hz8 TaxID=3347168 RepID=UPI0035D9A151